MPTQPVDSPFPYHVSKCIYIDGIHAYAGPDCPHADTEDEEGEILPPGWTAQNARRRP